MVDFMRPNYPSIISFLVANLISTLSNYAHSYYKLIRMNGLLTSQRATKTIIISAVLLVTLLIIGFMRLLTGSYIIAILLYLTLIWYLLREVGSYVMYPGSFFLTSSDIQMRFSRQIGSRMIGCFNALRQLSFCIERRRYETYENNIDFVQAISKHIKSLTAMLEMFQTTLSPRKISLLKNYRDLQKELNQKEEGIDSITELIAKPRLISSLPQNSRQFYGERMTNLGMIVKEMLETLKSFAPPTGTFELLKFRAYSENLYEIRFGFYNWQVLYNYQLFSIHTSDHKSLESAIIHNRKSYFNQPEQPNTSRKTVLFCNPNGVFIQFFGADNQYITNYLKLGYHVILWNYRGYGESTGSPSILRSQEDAYTVFQFYRNLNYEIEIVHGYSIGGAAAVSIPQKIANNPQSNPSDKIQILIIDRSFSSIGEMSIQFGKTLHSLTKLIFCAQNIDLSHQFQQAQCRKLLIWDYCDQVIPDRASVKNRIIKRKRSESKYQPDEEQQGRGLNEDGASLAIANVADRLAETVAKILLKRRASQSSDKELNFIDDQRESSMSTAGGLEENNFDFLLRVMDKVDGGGIVLFSNINELERIYEKKPAYFKHVCQSYVLGLVCYGSYFPLRPIVHNHQLIKQQTLAKIQKILKDIKERVPIDTANVDLSYSSTDQSALQIHKNVYFIYHRIAMMVEQFFCEEWFKLHGSLLPTNNGHNSSLSDQEFIVLNQFIKSSLGQDPRDLPSEKQEEIL